MGGPEGDAVVVDGEKGLKLSHEASVIVATERAETKMINFFMEGKLLFLTELDI